MAPRLLGTGSGSGLGTVRSLAPRMREGVRLRLSELADFLRREAEAGETPEAALSLLSDLSRKGFPSEVTA